MAARRQRDLDALEHVITIAFMRNSGDGGARAKLRPRGCSPVGVPRGLAARAHAKTQCGAAHAERRRRRSGAGNKPAVAPGRNVVAVEDRKLDPIHDLVSVLADYRLKSSDNKFPDGLLPLEILMTTD